MPELIEVQEDAKPKIEVDLQEYLSFIDSPRLTEAERKDLQRNLEQWDKTGDVEKIRTAGVSVEDNKNNYLLRHQLLSTEYLSKSKYDKDLTLKIDFKNNRLAEWRVGLADMLPPNVKRAQLTKADGSSVIGIRAQNPLTKRIGYYEENALKNGQYIYISCHTGDSCKPLETYTIPNKRLGDTNTYREHIEVYTNGAAKESSSDPIEKHYYDPQKGKETDKETHQQRIKVETKDALKDLRKSLPKQKRSGKTMELNGKKYEAWSRADYLTNMADSPEKARKQITRTDPVTGQSFEFLGARFNPKSVGDGVNLYLIPYLIEIEERIKAAGLSYDAKNITAFNWRVIRGGKNLSYHSWGMAIDINTAKHRLGSAETDISPAIAAIFESVGFKWGGRWKGRPDPMHFEFRINPFTSTDLLQSARAKQYLAAVQGRASTTGATPLPSPRQTPTPTKSIPPYSKELDKDIRKLPDGYQHTLMTKKTKNKIGKLHDDIKHNLPLVKILPKWRGQLNRFKAKYERNKHRYQTVANAANVPPELVAVIHYMEGGGNFGTYLHNGDPLRKKDKETGKMVPAPTTHVPKGKLFYDWTTAAIDAMQGRGRSRQRSLGLSSTSRDLAAMAAFTESFNGIGYHYRSKNIPSPYLYSGTNLYVKGKYTHDGKFSRTAVSKQLGVIPMLMVLGVPVS